MKVVIDKERCTGHGRCYDLSQEVFTDDDVGYGVVIVEDTPEPLRPDAERAVAACPERAISIAD